MSKQHIKACKTCPFSKQCTPGELGGSPVETYVGQSVGPFFLPCHACAGYKGNEQTLDDDMPQCAGAAIFRANIGRDELMPPALLRLFADSDANVFPSMQAFIKHHAPQLTPEQVNQLAADWPRHLHNEYRKAAAKGGVRPA